MKLKNFKNRTVVCFMCLSVLTLASFTKAGPALKDVFTKDFLIGAALNEDQTRGKNLLEKGLISKHFNTITSENILKWEVVHPKPGVFDFSASDQYVKFGEEHDMFIVGHVLVWHSQTPDWIFEDQDGKRVDRETMLGRMKEHIFTIVGRYKGRIDAWDVVNETINDDGSMRKSKWQQIIGDDFVEKAFEYAHEADPEAELYYNDYNMWQEKHREGAIRLVKNLQAKGIHIDGIGFQGHWGFDYPKLEELEEGIIACAKLGVKIDVTELDITVLPNAWDDRGADISKSFELQKKLNPYPDGLPADMQEKLAKRYAEFFSMFHKYADNISRVTFWGVQDGTSWRNNWPVKGRTDYPLLFDRNCKPKPAFEAVVKTAQKP